MNYPTRHPIYLFRHVKGLGTVLVNLHVSGGPAGSRGALFGSERVHNLNSSEIPSDATFELDHLYVVS
jgi:hypothetical protein